MTNSNTEAPAILSISQLQVAQAQMAFDRYDFGAPVRIVGRGFVNYGDDVAAEVEFQNEVGEFDGGPKGGFYVSFVNGTYEIAEAYAQIYGNQIGHLPEAGLREFEERLEEGFNMLDMEGVELVEGWLRAREDAKGYLRGTRIGQAQGVRDATHGHPLIEADKAVSRALTDGRGGISILIVGQRTDRLQEAVEARKEALQAEAGGFRP